MKSVFSTTHSSVEMSAAVVIQAWIRGHKSRRETSNVWLTYLSSVKECEGENAETKTQVLLLKHAESREKSSKKFGSKVPASCTKGKTNPYSIYPSHKPNNDNTNNKTISTCLV